MREIVPGSVLFAASESSQLLFDMRGMDDEGMAAFNGAVDEKGRRLWSECAGIVAREGMRPTFIGCGSEVLARNLLFVRESMADVLAWLWRQRLLVDTRTTGLAQLCRRMAVEDPCGYGIPELYEKVVKDFLVAALSGMTGLRLWDGREGAGGGHVVVLPDGQALCYHASDREQLRDYLFRNTFVEYVSCMKYRWGFVERDDYGRYVLPLNAAIRFKPKPDLTTSDGIVCT